MNATATVLAFDTSGPQCAAAIMTPSGITTRIDAMSKGQAEHLMPMLDEMLREAGLNWAGLDAIGVGIGPGNFTGIRIAVAAARGLALALNIPAIGVSSLEAQVEGLTGPVISVLDARSGRFYAQFFDATTRGTPEFLEPGQAPRCPAGIRPAYVGAAAFGEVIAAAMPPATAMAIIASRRMQIPQPRPAPLYLRPADAAPPRDAPPVVVP
ncbi:tRNA (adenosine(37)-N6)-threonylcarbamoyltransferase complex dimerization subunit type 1 TsaB [Loktanella sp. DSM 29012]|uniref:tRNA (adenosine(37)-N6)-threonylcarbamoyltransferase complex dimerization subunit type 1 TsaB n=1 Tax=Loktanella sp. DSM 29012 TaxID=1881056 RepID=UPI00210BE58D|nr:tRNA (adenosine(37)-N6)-threonylcarbamoyltransferase complex dimerization subunit type 1 TsaB [Loktanella sp. DSM 29012]